MLLFMLISLAPADEPKYLEFATTPKGIMVVNGKERELLKDATGEKVWSVADALEYFEAKGYEYVAVYTYTISDVLSGAFQTESRFLLRRKE